MAPTSFLLAVLAAACNATSSVMQRKANRDEPDERSFGIALLGDLLTTPAWLLGLVAMIGRGNRPAAASDLRTSAARRALLAWKALPRAPLSIVSRIPV